VSDPVARLNVTRVAFVGLVLLIVLVVLIRAPSDAPRPMNAAEGEPTEAPTGVEAVDADSARQALGGSVAPTPEETIEPPLASGCFRSGSSRDEVRAIMGAPDTVIYGGWEYGRSWVTFGYGVVLDFSNAGGNLRLCE
jgi:hypothetical protein